MWHQVITAHGPAVYEQFPIGRNRSVGRILYAGHARRTIIPLGGPLLDRSSHLPACSGGPPCRHEAGACLFDVAPDRGCRVSPCHAPTGMPVRQYGDGRTGVHRGCTLVADSSLWPCSSAFPERIAGRPLAAIVPCGVRTFLDAWWHRDRPTCPAVSLYDRDARRSGLKRPVRYAKPAPAARRPGSFARSSSGRGTRDRSFAHHRDAPSGTGRSLITRHAASGIGRALITWGAASGTGHQHASSSHRPVTARLAGGCRREYTTWAGPPAALGAVTCLNSLTCNARAEQGACSTA